jgi:hypothetical protein
VAITYVGGAATSGGLVATLTLTFPTVQAGDKAFIFWAHTSPATVSVDPTAAGFAYADYYSDSTLGRRLYIKTCTGTEGGSTITFTVAAAQLMSAVMVVYRGCTIGAISTWYETGTDLIKDPPAQIITRPDETLVSAVCEKVTTGTASYTPPAGVTKRQEHANVGTNGITSAVGDDLPSPVRAVGTAVAPGSWTGSGTASGMGVFTTVSLIPTGAPQYRQWSPHNPVQVSGCSTRWLAEKLGQGDNAAVAYWHDNGPYINNAYRQGQIEARLPVPLKQTFEMNGQSVIRFESSAGATEDSRYFQTRVIAEPFTIFVVNRPVNPSLVRGADTIQAALTTGNGNGYCLFLHAGKWKASVPGVASTDGTTTIAAGQANVATMSRAAGAGQPLNLYVNGTAEGTPITNQSTASGGTWLGGNNVASTQTWYGDIAEVLIFHRVLSAAERAIVHSYIQDVYGVTVSDYIPAFATTGPITDDFNRADAAGLGANWALAPVPPSFGIDGNAVADQHQNGTYVDARHVTIPTPGSDLFAQIDLMIIDGANVQQPGPAVLVPPLSTNVTGTGSHYGMATNGAAPATTFLIKRKNAAGVTTLTQVGSSYGGGKGVFAGDRLRLEYVAATDTLIANYNGNEYFRVQCSVQPLLETAERGVGILSTGMTGGTRLDNFVGGEFVYAKPASQMPSNFTDPDWYETVDAVATASRLAVPQYSYAGTKGNYYLRDGRFFFKVTQRYAGGNMQAVFRPYSLGTPKDDYIGWNFDSGSTITGQYVSGGGPVTLTGSGHVFDPAKPYYSIRETAGAVYWERSADGVEGTWELMQSYATTPAWLRTGCPFRFDGMSNASGTMWIESLNSPTVPIGATLAVTATIGAAGLIPRSAGATLAVTASIGATALRTAGLAATRPITATITAGAVATVRFDVVRDITATIVAGANLSRVMAATLAITATPIAGAQRVYQVSAVALNVTASIVTDAFISLIKMIGQPVGEMADYGGDVLLTFDTPPQNGDVTVLVGGHNARGPVGPATAGYTTAHVNTTVEPYFGMWFKRQGASPDATVTGLGSGHVEDVAAYVTYVLRGVDAATPLDSVAVGAAGVNPPPVDVVTPGTYVIVGSGLSQDPDTTPGTVSGYANTVVEVG